MLIFIELPFVAVREESVDAGVDLCRECGLMKTT